MEILPSERNREEQEVIDFVEGLDDDVGYLFCTPYFDDAKTGFNSQAIINISGLPNAEELFKEWKDTFVTRGFWIVGRWEKGSKEYEWVLDNDGDRYRLSDVCQKVVRENYILPE